MLAIADNNEGSFTGLTKMIIIEEDKADIDEEEKLF